MCLQSSSEYTWVVPLKDKKEHTINNNVQRNLDKFRRKPNKFI